MLAFAFLVLKGWYYFALRCVPFMFPTLDDAMSWVVLFLLTPGSMKFNPVLRLPCP